MRATPYRFRAYEAEDFAAVAAMWVEAWSATGLKVDFAARRPWLEAHLTSLAAAGVDVAVAMDEDGRCGGLMTIDRRSGELDQLCVAVAAQGGGLAKALLEEAKRRTGAEICLSVNADNGRALAFYKREGFQIVGDGVSAAGLATWRLAWRPIGRRGETDAP